MQLKIPDFGLVVLIGASGAGKTTFARRHFRPSEILSSDDYRTVVGDDDRGPETTRHAFEVIRLIAARRLRARRLAVIDATNVQPGDRRDYVSLARAEHAPATAIALDIGESRCVAHNAGRGNDARPRHVVSRQARALRRHWKTISREGYRQRIRLRTVGEIDEAEIERVPLPSDRRDLAGPFDIIGDVHGCLPELTELLERLGYRVNEGAAARSGFRWAVRPPEGRIAVFAGDVNDRGPDSAGALELAMEMVAQGCALAVPGNHENKLGRALAGRAVEPKHGLAKTLEEIEKRPEAFRERLQQFLQAMPTHYVLDRGRLVVAHAGLKEELQNRRSGDVRSFCLYGETTGETDPEGLPVRGDWARDYRGKAAVVYGHTPVQTPEWVNNTICIDTGCVFGGGLSALRWPEREIVTVPAERAHNEPPKAFREAGDRSRQQESDRLLSTDDIRAPLRIHTTLGGTVHVRREQTAAALETMSRFAVDPRWLIYLPPTMAPADTSSLPGLLEHPDEAFGYFRARDVKTVQCQEKHMGSRAVLIAGRSPDALRTRFGVDGNGLGITYTRTGRRFFTEPDTEDAVLAQVRAGMDDAGLWDELQTDWVCIDAEVMPWSAKGEGLVQDHYRPVAEAGRMGLEAAVRALEAAEGDGIDALRTRFGIRREQVDRYDAAYRRYNWAVDGTEGVRIAPFHLLASEGRTHFDRNHEWHMSRLDRICRNQPVLQATQRRTVAVDDEEQIREATAWWTASTEGGAEGMVVKPLEFTSRNGKETVQPAIKCRGREYLRIIYGPEYSEPERLEKLRRRNSRGKMALAVREFALGVHALESFVQRRPLRVVHQAVFGILALESEPIDPRL